MASELDDVIRQMREVGIEPPDSFERAFTRVHRWKPAGEKGTKKAAWVRLHEWISPTSNRRFINGAFGIRNEIYKIRPADNDWTPAERAAAAEERKAAIKAAEQQREADAQSAATKAAKLWERARDATQGPLHPYLAKKQVGAFGLAVGYGNTLYLPVRDIEGKLQGLQFIPEDCSSKKFSTAMIKEGRFHLIGEVKKEHPIAFGEGYATCATGHMATGWPVVTCWDSGNLEPVIAQWRKLYPEAQLVIFGDDDRHLLKRLADRLLNKFQIAATHDELKQLGEMEWERPDGVTVRLKAGWANDAQGVVSIKGSIKAGDQVEMLVIENSGRAKAMSAAKRHKAIPLFPAFQGNDNPGTDWNDLACEIGLPGAREQLLAAFEKGGEPQRPRATKPPQADGKKADAKPEPANLSFLERFTLIYGTTTVHDAEKNSIMKIEALKTAFGKSIDWWQSHPDRKMVDQENVVFDPTCKIAKPGTHINLFTGFEVEPEEGDCSLIVKHLENLCGNDERLIHWVASWLALPLQRPGTKMRTSLILHGRQEGTGKSLMMDVMRAIYGRYSRSITQLQLQSEFNAWQSGMLFCVAEEVVAASDRRNLKNLLQNMVTNTVVQINEKNMPVREERSHANFVFLSNEQIPMILNETDRRYTVLKVEEVRNEEYFREIGKQIDNGGIGAFYRWLLRYDLDGFNEFTRPFETRAREHLITLGMQPDQRFMAFWTKGYTDLPFCSCKADDLYLAFQSWCRVNGEKFISNKTVFGLTATDVLERLGCPTKKVVRVDAYRREQIEKNDFSEEVQTQTHQATVYFVHAEIQQVALDGGVPDEKTRTEDCMDKRVMEKRVRQFQYHLGPLVAASRRSV